MPGEHEFRIFRRTFFFDSPSMVDPRKRTKIGKYGGQGRVVRKRKSKRILDKKVTKSFVRAFYSFIPNFFPSI